MRWLLTASGLSADVPISQLAEAKEGKGGPFWLDLQDPGPEDYEALRSQLGIHRLTVDDISKGGQRPKWEQYPGYVFMVLITPVWAQSELSLREHYLCLSTDWVVSLHRGEAPWFDRVRQRDASDPALARAGANFLTYTVTGAIVDACFSSLDAIDDAVDALEDRLVEGATNRDLSEINLLRHAVTDLRRVLGAQRDCFQMLVTQGLGQGQGEASLYYRDTYDHLTRQYETVDSLRDLLSGAMDTYLSNVSNRLNGTMKALTVVASLFLPLTFLTGFFGMNFAYQTSVVQRTGIAFAGAILLMFLSLAIQLVLFRRRGWL